MKALKVHTVKMNITMTKEFYDILTELANSQYLQVNEYIQEILTHSVLDHMPKNLTLSE